MAFGIFKKCYSKQFPFGDLPSTLQELIVEWVEIKAALKLLRTNRILRFHILNNGPFPKRIAELTYAISDIRQNEAGNDVTSHFGIHLVTDRQGNFHGDHYMADFKKKRQKDPKKHQMIHPNLLKKITFCRKIRFIHYRSMFGYRKRTKREWEFGNYFPENLQVLALDLKADDLQGAQNILKLFQGEVKTRCFLELARPAPAANIPIEFRELLSSKIENCQWLEVENLPISMFQENLYNRDFKRLQYGHSTVSEFQEACRWFVRNGLPFLEAGTKMAVLSSDNIQDFGGFYQIKQFFEENSEWQGISMFSDELLGILDEARSQRAYFGELELIYHQQMAFKRRTMGSPFYEVAYCIHYFNYTLSQFVFVIKSFHKRF